MMIIKKFLYNLGLDFFDLYHLFPKQERSLKKILEYKQFVESNPIKERQLLLSKWEEAVVAFLSEDVRMSKILVYAESRQRKPRPLSEHMEDYDKPCKYTIIKTYYDRGELPFDVDNSLIEFIKAAELRRCL